MSSSGPGVQVPGQVQQVRSVLKTGQFLPPSKEKLGLMCVYCGLLFLCLANLFRSEYIFDEYLTTRNMCLSRRWNGDPEPFPGDDILAQYCTGTEICSAI